MATFFECTSLKGVNIPSSLTSIPTYVFYGCSSLTDITIPSGVTSIGDGAFYECSGLTSIRIPANVTSIGWWAFMGCSGLTSVTFEEGSRLTTLLGNLAFMGCQALRYFDASACTNMTTTTVNRNSVMSAASALLYLPEGYTSSGANVIIGSTCDSLALTDGNTVEIPKAFTASKVTYNRTFTPDVTATVCLPFTVAVANVTGGDFYKLGNVSDDYVVTMNKVTGSLEANTPYIFKPSATALAVSGSANVNAVSISTNATATDGNWAFCGTYEKVSWATDDDFGGATIYGYAANDYGDKVKAGDFVKVKAGNSYINPCRAYLKYTGGTAAKGFKTQATLPDRLTVRLVDSDGTTTDIDSVKGEEETVKNPTRHNLAGQRVGSGYKGIVIMNGKKTYIK